MMTSIAKSTALARAGATALILVFATLSTTACRTVGDEADHQASGPQPDVLIIMIDALRADRLGVNGNQLGLTPNIDALAGAGANFTRAFSHSTWTKPSIATLMTSLYPSQHGLQLLGDHAEGGFRVETLVDGLTTMAERFEQAGYSTGAVVNQVHLKDRFGFGQGFADYRDLEGKDAFEINTIFSRWLDGLGPEPFFGYVHYLDVHWPYTRSLEEHEGLFGDTEMTEEPSGAAAKASEWAAGLASGDLEALESRYDYEVAYTDAAVGEIVKMLDGAGRLENTLILLTSDHGEAFMERGRLQHGFAPHEEVVHIPLVVRLPESLRGAVSSVTEPVGLIDVFPSLLDLAGLQPEPQALGQTFAPILRGEASPPRLVFFDTIEAIGVRSASARLLRHQDGRFEYSDLEADPSGVTSSIHATAGDCTGGCRELLQPLSAFHKLLERTRSSNPTGRAFMTTTEVERLRALGYLE